MLLMTILPGSDAGAASAGLVAAYGFNEGGGLSAGDASGSGNAGTISGASWTADGRFGGALAFDGANDWVSVADSASLDLADAMTLEAWVYPTALTGWRTVMLKETASDLAYGLYANDNAGRPAGYVRVGGSIDVTASAALPLSTWTHLALSYDGLALRLYRNGVEVGARALTGVIIGSGQPLRIGGNGVWGEYFSGRIDEVRVYNRALSAAEIQDDMQTSVELLAAQLVITNPGAGATLSGPTIDISYTTAGPLTAEVEHVRFSLDGGPDMIDPGPMDGIFQVADVTPGVHTLDGYLVRADNSKILGSDADSISFTVTAPDTMPPSVTLTVPADGDSVSGTVSLVATASDDIGVESVQFTLDGANLGPPQTTAPYTLPWDTSSSANGLHVLGVVARDLSGKTGSAGLVSVQVANLNDPALVGRWSAPVDLPTVAVQLVQLHTGKALIWAGEFSSAADFGELWDPVTDAITPVPNPFTNIFCAAHSALADGRILVAGGHDRRNGILGLADSNVFDPVTEAWTSLPPMAFRRWYPTLTTLGDGRVMVTSGSDVSELEFVEIPELYDPVANTWTPLTNAPMSIPQYPFMFLLPDGRVLQAGSVEETSTTKVLDIDAQQWTTVDPRVLEGGSAVMYAPGQVMKSGSPSDTDPLAPAVAATYVLDMNSPAPAWRETAPMAFPRTYHNLTSLPDGTVLVTGGTAIKDPIDLTPAVLEAELWSPDTETWVTLAPQQNPRLYHSTAILLPDARVAVAGGGNLGGATDMLNAEIYSPPYLFKGARPSVTSVPGELQYGASFTVQTPDASDISAVSLIRPSATTHGFDQDQRFVPLSFSVAAGALEVQAPASPNLAPPGYYMLFLLNGAGVPSVAEFVRFPAGYEDSQPPTEPTGLTASGAAGTVALSWGPALDDTGVAKYEVHRSAVAGFAPSDASRVAQTTATTYTDVGLAAGSYHYLVVAVDIAGNIGLPSNEAAATVSDDVTPPIVSLTSPADGATLSQVVAITAAASDGGGIAGVQFTLDGATLGGEDTVAPFSFSWNTAGVPNGVHVLTAIARDESQNMAESSAVTVTVSNAQVPPGLVAAYGFDEGSGSLVVDASGNGNTGTISGASWSAQGKSGGTLSFDGIDDWVSVADADSLDLGSGMTLEAWVYPTALSGWRTVILKEATNDLAYGLYAHDNAPRPAGYVDVGGIGAVAGTVALPLATWTHLAVTYDGALLRLFQNGVEVGAQALAGPISGSTQPLRIGGNGIWGEFFRGRVDEVRIYDRALAAAEIQADMRLVGPAAPSLTITQPQNGSTVTGTTVDVSYTVAGDMTGVSHVHFRLDAGPDVMDPAPIDGAFQFANLTPGLHSVDGYLVRTDHSKIDGSDAPTVSFTVTVPDVVPPTVVVTSPPGGSSLQGIVTIDAFADDDIAVAGVQFTLDGAVLGAEDTAAPFSHSWNTATVPNGVYVLTAIARDAAGNVTESSAVTVTVSNAQQAPPGLVAAYGFDEGSGTSAGDASGNGNTGTLNGATWTAQGYFGGALSFDGVDDSISVADADSLDLTTGMTLEAWVYPTALSGWRAVIMKETASDLAYALYAHDNAPRPAGYVRIGAVADVPGTAALPLNAWTHLALSYDGSLLRLYQNGLEVGARAVSGGIASSAQALRIGGNAVWGEYFSGRIDEVRVYDRALTVAELRANMDAPVAPQPMGQPTRSSPIVVDSSRGRVWVVNPDNDSVAAVDADALVLELEIPVATHPSSLALDGLGQLWVTCRDDDSVWVLDAADGALREILQLPWGSAPVSIVFTPEGATGYIAIQGGGQIQQVDAASRTLGDTLLLGPTPRALAITGDGRRLLVSRFISGDGAGTIWSVDLDSRSLGATLDLPLDTASQDGAIAARGLPNYLAGIAIDPQGGSAWAVAKKDNILRGGFRDGQPLTFETTVRALVTSLDLVVNAEQVDSRLDIDNHAQPSAIAFSESGEQLFVTMQGNNRMIVLDPVLGSEITRVATGLAPQGVAIDPVTGRVFTKDFMSRTVTVFDGAQLLSQGIAQLPEIARISTVTAEKLSSAVLQGKQIFYNAADPRMGRDGYLSCAVCHLDGEHDGRVWDFTDRGEGLRNTISLKGQGGDAGAPLHWSGNFDEVQDFEHDIRSAFGGSGFMADADFLVGTRDQPLGDPKSGVSPELDALAAYVRSLQSSARSPHRGSNGTMTVGAQAGQALFEGLGCPSCHLGQRFSDSPTGLRHDVGTITVSSGQRLGGPLDGLDTPMLLGLWATAPYLHDGSAATLRGVLTTANPVGLHGDVPSLSPLQLDQLIEYLLQLEFTLP